MYYNFPHLYLSQTGSTNEVALELLSKTTPEPGFMVITDFQTAGRGQYGRVWQSEAGSNLLVSYIFGPLDWSTECLFDLHLHSIPAIHKILFELGIHEVRIKWPNDLFVRSSKLGGILIQNLVREGVLQWTVIGLGLNVNQAEFPAGLIATSLFRETGIRHSVPELAAKIREALLACFLHKQDRAELLAAYNRVLYGKDTLLHFIREDGSTFQGIIRFVDARGALVVEHLHGEMESFSFGAIRYATKPKETNES